MSMLIVYMPTPIIMALVEERLKVDWTSVNRFGIPGIDSTGNISHNFGKILQNLITMILVDAKSIILC